MAANNALRQTVAQRPGDLVFVSLAGALLLTTQIFSLYQDLARYAAEVSVHWRLVASCGAALMLMAGYYAGLRLGRYAAGLSEQAWLAVLPRPDAARRGDARQAAMLLGCVPAAAFGAFVPMMAHAVRLPPLASDGGALVLFGSAFAWASRNVAAHPTFAGRSVGDRTERTGALFRLLAPFDRARPRWLGTWGVGRRGTGLALGWAFSLLLVGGGAGAMTLIQGWPWPSLVASVVGGHGFFLAALDARPLLSPALRGQPVAYGRAVAGLVRLPLIASFVWFGLAVLPALFWLAGFSRLPAAALILLLLDAFFTACLCTVPRSHRQGLILYGVGGSAVLQQGAEYGVPYGMLVAVLVGAIALYLVGRARRRFRAHG